MDLPGLSDVSAECSLSPADAADQESRVVELRPWVERIERSVGSLVVEFGAGVDVELVARLVRLEQACGGDAFIITWVDEPVAQLRYMTADGRLEAVLADLARVFDAQASA